MAVSSTIPVIKMRGSDPAATLAALRKNREGRKAEVSRDVSAILADVRRRGDVAVCAYCRKFDGAALTPKTLRIDPLIIDARASEAPAALRTALVQAAKRIRAYHEKQRSVGFSMVTAEGTLSQLVKPLHRVGVYVPGGYTVYPSSVLMNVIPAQVAGVAQIVAVTPPRKGFAPAVAAALKLLGIDEVYQVGGPQAVAALAYGTRSMPAVDKIVGPGNAYVAEAKRQVYGTVDIDSIAGPSEVAIMADDSANPTHVALDLLAQAEHGSGDEMAVCVTESAKVARAVRDALARETDASPVREVIRRLAPGAIAVVVTPSRSASIAFVNACAPEHLQIMTRSPRVDLKGIRNAGAVFLGPHTPVALGDYFIGTNHVLPTGGMARFASPLGVDDFVKRMSVAEASARGLALAAPYVSRLARAESFVHHALSVERRVGRR